jgi:chorismate mutase
MDDLEIFRTEIDEIDKKLIDNLSMRFMLAKKI